MAGFMQGRSRDGIEARDRLCVVGNSRWRDMGLRLPDKIDGAGSV
jgi:hypothetical protein